MSRQSVYDFADRSVTDRVRAKDENGVNFGKGVCWDLAYEALRQGGDWTPRVVGVKDEDPSLYRWSNQRLSFANAARGDILQFRNWANASVTEKLTVNQGNTYLGDYEVTPAGGRKVIPRHTAILVSKGKNGLVKVIEQNGGKGIDVNRDEYFVRAVDVTETKSSANDLNIHSELIKNWLAKESKDFKDADKFIWRLRVQIHGSMTIYQPRAGRRAGRTTQNRRQTALIVTPSPGSSSGADFGISNSRRVMNNDLGSKTWLG